jgi:hypothetical protein
MMVTLMLVETGNDLKEMLWKQPKVVPQSGDQSSACHRYLVAQAVMELGPGATSHGRPLAQTENPEAELAGIDTDIGVDVDV